MALVVQEAFELMTLFSNFSSLIPIRTITSVSSFGSPLAGAANHSFAPAVMWSCFSYAVKTPVASITISTFKSCQGNKAGSFHLKT